MLDIQPTNTEAAMCLGDVLTSSGEEVHLRYIQNVTIIVLCQWCSSLLFIGSSLRGVLESCGSCHFLKVTIHTHTHTHTYTHTLLSMSIGIVYYNVYSAKLAWLRMGLHQHKKEQHTEAINRYYGCVMRL